MKPQVIETIILLILLTITVLSIGNAVFVYKRSYYLESTDRVDLQRLVDNIEQLERQKLVTLSQRLATISQSDFGILLLLNQEFRRALILLIVSMLLNLAYLFYTNFVKSFF